MKPITPAFVQNSLSSHAARSSNPQPHSPSSLRSGLHSIGEAFASEGAHNAVRPITILLSEAMGAEADKALGQLAPQTATITQAPAVKGSSPGELTSQVANFMKRESINGNSFDLLVVRGNVEVGQQLLGDLPESALPSSVIRAGTGMDNIDTQFLSQHGIAFQNTPSVNTQATAEMAVGLMFATVRNIPAADTMVKQGVMDRSVLMGKELCGKTLGIVGVGRIGQTVAKIADAIGMKVIGLKPRSAAEGATAPTQINGGYVNDIDTLFEKADVVTLHVPLTNETRGMVNADRLAKLNGVIINTARGGVVDEQALLDSLNSGQMKGAGLDVLAQDPAPAGSVSDLLARHPKVVVTPHTGGQTQEASYKMGQAVVDEARAMFLDRVKMANAPLN